MRPLFFIGGIMILAFAWLGPLPELSGEAFFAHMTLHMTVVAVAAPLVSLGIAGSWLDPVPKMPVFFSPLGASVLEFVVVWAWHMPQLHHLARHDALGMVCEQGSFLFAGVMVWLSAFGGDPARTNRVAAGILALLLTSMHMTLLGALLALTPRPLYEHAARVGSLTPLQDQHLGGAIMLLVGSISYLAGGLWLTARLLRAGRLQHVKAR